MFVLLDGYYNSTIVKSLLRPPPPSVRNVHDLLHSNYPVALNDWWLTIRNFQVWGSPLKTETDTRDNYYSCTS